MKIILTGLFLLIGSNFISYAQTDNSKWKPLVVNDEKKVWVDETGLQNVKGDKFEIWLLQMYVPPLRMDGITGDVYRSKTLYAVDLNSVKYGIEQVVYYNADNKELFSYDYKIKNYEDNLKYTYPVLENSTMHLVIKELYNVKAEKN